MCRHVLCGSQEELAARVAEQQAAVMAAGLLDKKESEDSNAVIGPSMPEHEPPHHEVYLTSKPEVFVICSETPDSPFCTVAS